MKNKILRVCRVVAGVGSSVSLVCNVTCGNWIGVFVDAATLAIVI